MPDFGGDGISLRGAAGKKLREQQEKDLKEFQDMLNDQLKLKEYLKREKDSKGGKVGKKGFVKKASGGLIEENVLQKLKRNDPDKKLRDSGQLPPLKKNEIIGKGQGKSIKIKITKSY